MNISNETIKLYQKALDTVFVHESKTDILREYAPEAYATIEPDFNRAGVIKLPKGSSGGLANYKAVNQFTPAADYVHYQTTGGDGYKRNDARLEFEEFNLQCNRGVEFQIDRVEGKKIDDLLLTYVVSQFPRESVVPEVDAFRFAYLASRANLSYGNLVTETPTADGGDQDIFTLLSNALAKLFDMGVPEEKQVIFVNPEIHNLLVNSNKITRYLGVSEIDYGGLKVKIDTFLGRPLIKVPARRFFNKITLTDNGYAPADGAKYINYMIVSADTTLIFDILGRMHVYDSDSVHLGFDGWAVDYHLYHGIYVPDNKVPGLFVSLGKTLKVSSAGRLFVATKAGSAAGTTAVESFSALPGNLLVTKIGFDTVDHNYGVKLSSDKIKPIGDDIPATGSNLRFFGCDSNGLIIAKTDGAVAVNKK